MLFGNKAFKELFRALEAGETPVLFHCSAGKDRTGVAAMLIFQVISNIGMCLFVMPVIGLTLPFISYGGTSIVTLFAAMGMVSGIQKRARPEWLR